MKNIFSALRLGTDNRKTLVKHLKTLFNKFVQECKIAREKLSDIPKTNYELGLLHLDEGNINEATMRFKMVTFLKPDFASAHYQLSKCFILKGDEKQALSQLYNLQKLNPSFEGLDYMLAKLETPKKITLVPDFIAKEYRNKTLAPYNSGNDFLEQTGFIGHKILAKQVMLCIKDKNPNLHLLDINCGYGLCTKIFFEKEVIQQAHGVDIYDKMVETCKNLKFNQEKIFNTVEQNNIASYLQQKSTKFNLIVSQNLLFNIGCNYSLILDEINNSLQQGGILAFILQKVDSIGRYKLDIKLDCFNYGYKFVEKALKEAKFKEVNCKLYKINDFDDEAYIFVAVK